MGKPLTYQQFRGQLRRQAFDHFLARGYGGLLLCLGVAGIGALAVPLDAPLPALGLGLALGGVGWAMLRAHARSPEARRDLIERILERRHDHRDIEREPLRRSLAKSLEVCALLAAKIDEIGREQGENADLGQILTNADTLLDLQLASARQVEELDRVLSVVGYGPPGGERRGHRTGSFRQRDRSGRELVPPGEPPETDGRSSRSRSADLLHQNAEALLRERQSAQELVPEIVDRLKTLLLQVTQIEADLGDRVRSAALVEESDAALREIQEVVDARDETVRQLARARVS